MHTFKMVLDILNSIVDSMNNYMETEHPSYKKITIDRLQRFLGVILLMDILKDKNMNVREFWSEKYGQSVIKKTVSINRYKQITACLRFDTRFSRNRSDKIAPIHLIFDQFVCIKNYTPSDQMIIDEQLVAFRGRCPFRMYIPSKPGKYGLKI